MKIINLIKRNKVRQYLTEGNNIWKLIERNGKVIKQKYISKICKRCNHKFPASHKTQIYCSIKCIGKFNPAWRLGKKFPNERNGIGNKRVASNGYVEIYLPNHVLADKRGRVAEHRLVIFEQTRKIPECVHHINGIRSDNRPENLIDISRINHNSFHKKEEAKFRNRWKNGRFS